MEQTYIDKPHGAWTTVKKRYTAIHSSHLSNPLREIKSAAVPSYFRGASNTRSSRFRTCISKKQRHDQKSHEMTGVIVQARNTHKHTSKRVTLSPLHAHDREITPEVPRIAPTDRQSISQTGQRGIDAVVNVLVEGDHTLLYFRIGSRE